MSNPMQLIMTAMRNGADPRQIIAQMARNNPQMAQAAQMIGGKSDAELRKIAMNMCKERGTSPETVVQSLFWR